MRKKLEKKTEQNELYVNIVRNVLGLFIIYSIVCILGAIFLPVNCKNSQWLAAFPIRKDFEKSIYKHYQVFTYDYVFNIVAVSYELNCDLAATDFTLPVYFPSQQYH